jgi:hypothetical protein
VKPILSIYSNDESNKQVEFDFIHPFNIFLLVVAFMLFSSIEVSSKYLLYTLSLSILLDSG